MTSELPSELNKGFNTITEAATVKSIRLMLWFGQAERAALIIYWFIGSKKFRQPAADDDIQLLEDYPAVHLTSL